MFESPPKIPFCQFYPFYREWWRRNKKKTGNIFRVSKAILFSICHSEKQIHRRYGTISSRFSGKKKNDLIYESYQFIPSGIGGERPLGFA
jgi:hypothetical protein